MESQKSFDSPLSTLDTLCDTTAFMWNKIYIVALSIAVLAMGVLTYLSYDWLHSITKPSEVKAHYESSSYRYWTVLFVSSIALLVLANVVLWLHRRAWALWATFAYFAVFVLLATWWLNNLFLNYQKTTNLTESSFSLLGLGGALVCVVAGVGIFFDQFLVSRMRDRMFGTPEPGAATAAIEPVVPVENAEIISENQEIKIENQ